MATKHPGFSRDGHRIPRIPIQSLPARWNGCRCLRPGDPPRSRPEKKVSTSGGHLFQGMIHMYNIYVYLDIYIYIHMYIYVYIYVYISIYKYMYIYIMYIYVCNVCILSIYWSGYMTPRHFTQSIDSPFWVLHASLTMKAVEPKVGDGPWWFTTFVAEQISHCNRVEVYLISSYSIVYPH